jgi:hypothetical protein
LVANSPGLIAGSNVLHRLLMPRHPPCALHSLSQQRQNNTRANNTRIQHANSTCRATNETPPARPPIKGTSQHKQHNCATGKEYRSTPFHNQTKSSCKDARVHYADLKQQPHQHHTPTNTADMQQREEPKTPTTTRHHQQPPSTRRRPPTAPSGTRLILQDPTVCLTPPPTNAGQQEPEPPTSCAHRKLRTQTSCTVRASTIPLVNTTIRARTFAWRRGVCSLERR